MCKVVCIRLVIGELTGPRQRVEVAVVAVLILGTNVVSIVFNILAPASPTNVLALGVLFTVHDWFHSCVIQAIRLEEIAYGEAVLASWLGVFYLEIKPLGVATGVQVISHVKFILGVISLKDFTRLLNNTQLRKTCPEKLTS